MSIDQQLAEDVARYYPTLGTPAHNQSESRSKHARNLPPSAEKPDSFPSQTSKSRGNTIWSASGQRPTPAYEVDPRNTDLVLRFSSAPPRSYILKPMTSGQASLFNALLSLAHPGDEHSLA